MQPELQSLIPLVELTQRSIVREGQNGRSTDGLCVQAQTAGAMTLWKTNRHTYGKTFERK